MNIEKRNAGWGAAEYVEDGMVVGLGTGSTARYAVEKIGERVMQENLDIRCIPTSENTKKLADESNIPLANLDDVKKIDLTIDGADEVGPDYDLIKGGGGALLREKMVAHNTDKYIVIVDPSKMVEKLGEDFDLPVEVVPFWTKTTSKAVDQLGCKSRLRSEDKAPYKTDNGNHILDCDFGHIKNKVKLSEELNSIPGVIENGLFIDVSDKIIIGKEKGFDEISVD